MSSLELLAWTKEDERIDTKGFAIHRREWQREATHNTGPMTSYKRTKIRIAPALMHGNTNMVVCAPSQAGRGRDSKAESEDERCNL